VHPLEQASDHGQVTVCTDLTGTPQPGADHPRQRHPDHAPLLLDPDLVGLHLPEVAWRLDQVLRHRLALDTRPPQPMRHRPFVKPTRDDDRLQRTAVGDERDHERHGLGRAPQAIERRALCGSERLVACRAQEPPVRTRMDANIALSHLAPGGTHHIRAAYGGGVHNRPPRSAWTCANMCQEESGWTPVVTAICPYHG
jgi:hypothetical protein